MYVAIAKYLENDKPSSEPMVTKLTAVLVCHRGTMDCDHKKYVLFM